MRALADIVDSITGVIRFLVIAAMLSALCLGLLVTGCVAYITPDPAVEAERELLLREMALEESRQAEVEAMRSQREHELAKDGWGYGAADGGE